MSSPVAVLVDGENIRADFAVQILNAATRYGTPTIRRIYQDAAKQNGWSDMPGWKLVHSGTGKNATDMLLCIEAVDLALIQGITQVVIVSSDGDFSHLATYLREHGTEVIGIGEIKTPRKFSKACSEFINLSLAAAPSDPVPLHAPKPAPSSALSSVDQNIMGILRVHGDNHGWLETGKLNVLMRERVPSFQISTTTQKTWRAYLEGLPHLYKLMTKDNQTHVRTLIDADHGTGT